MKKILVALLLLTTASTHAVTFSDAAQITKSFLLQPGASKTDAAIYVACGVAGICILFFTMETHASYYLKKKEWRALVNHLKKPIIFSLIGNSLIAYMLKHPDLGTVDAITPHLAIPFIFAILIKTNFPPPLMYVPPITGLIGLGVKNGLMALIKR